MQLWNLGNYARKKMMYFSGRRISTVSIGKVQVKSTRVMVFPYHSNLAVVCTYYCCTWGWNQYQSDYSVWEWDAVSLLGWEWDCQSHYCVGNETVLVSLLGLGKSPVPTWLFQSQSASESSTWIQQCDGCLGGRTPTVQDSTHQEHCIASSRMVVCVEAEG